MDVILLKSFSIHSFEGKDSIKRGAQRLKQDGDGERNEQNEEFKEIGSQWESEMKDATQNPCLIQSTWLAFFCLFAYSLRLIMKYSLHETNARPGQGLEGNDKVINGEMRLKLLTIISQGCVLTRDQSG